MRCVGGVNRILGDVHREKSCRSLINGLKKLPKGFSAGSSGAVRMRASCPRRDYKRIVDTLERKRRWLRNSLDTIWSLPKKEYRDYSVEGWWWEAGALRFESWWAFDASGSSSHGKHPQARSYDHYFDSKNRITLYFSLLERLSLSTAWC